MAETASADAPCIAHVTLNDPRPPWLLGQWRRVAPPPRRACSPAFEGPRRFCWLLGQARATLSEAARLARPAPAIERVSLISFAARLLTIALTGQRLLDAEFLAGLGSE